MYSRIFHGVLGLELIVWVAPELLGLLELPVVDVDRDDRRRAGDLATLNGGVADAAATDDGEQSRPTPPVFTAAPKPAMTPHRGADGGSLGVRVDLVHWPAATVFSAKAPIPSAGDSSVPSVRVIFLVALWVAKQYHGLPLLQARQFPQTARQLRMTKSPGATSVTPSPTASTIPAASWPRRKGSRR